MSNLSNQKTHQWIIIASILGFTGVALGAFGAHGLETTLEVNNRVDTFETAARYHMYHALALIGVAWLSTQYTNKWITWAGYLLTIGVVVFSGSLYILAIADLSFMGTIAPIGGTSMIAGWGCMALTAYKQT